MNEPVAWPHAAPELVVKAGGTEKTLRAGSSYRVGRDPRSDIAVNDNRVSWNHVVVEAKRGAWYAQDCGSRNGTFVAGRKVDRFEIIEDCVLRLGNPADGPALFCSVSRPVPLGPPPVSPGFQRPSVDRRPTAVMRAPARTLRIGRADDNDIVLADLSVSRHHAELRNADGGRYEVLDLDSHNGTFLNGARVTARAPVTEQDIIGIGPATFRLVGGELREFIDEGDVSVVAQDLTVRAGDQILLDHASFPVAGRSVVAVIGPSGAGKTTLLRALTGIEPATEGAVLYDGRDLYSHYAELRHRIGLVPQEDVIFSSLTPRRSLGYAAELRFPGDASPEERHARVREVIDELALSQTTRERPEPPADARASALSGGERKRVSIGLELLTKPSVLFLDEPTSSLDVELKEDVVDSMRDLAKDGRTVIMVTHDLDYLDKCDRVLVLMPGGRVVFYGPSAEGLSYFGKTRWVDVYRALRSEPERDWPGEFRRSSCYQEYVAGGLARRIPESARETPEPPPMPRSLLAQLAILCRRYTALIAADRGFLISLAVLPIVLGLLIRPLAGSKGLAGTGNSNAPTTLLVLTIGASFTGAANSVRELIKERAIYLRERMAGLSVGAYLLSKVVVLGFISGIQAAVLVLLGVAGEPMPGRGVVVTSPLAELMLGVAVLAIASMAAGLMVSALVNSSEKTMPVLVLVSIAQVILSGGLLALGAGLQQLSWLAPARWGFAATASTVNLNAILPPGSHTDPLWDHRPSAWLTAMGLQILLAAVYVVIAWWRLVRLDPGRGRPRIKLRLPASAVRPARRPA